MKDQPAELQEDSSIHEHEPRDTSLPMTMTDSSGSTRPAESHRAASPPFTRWSADGVQKPSVTRPQRIGDQQSDQRNDATTNDQEQLAELPAVPSTQEVMRPIDGPQFIFLPKAVYKIPIDDLVSAAEVEPPQ